jgi:hypothetical protein
MHGWCVDGGWRLIARVVLTEFLEDSEDAEDDDEARRDEEHEGAGRTKDLVVVLCVLCVLQKLLRKFLRS